jgi:hypothetical protein
MGSAVRFVSLAALATVLSVLTPHATAEEAKPSAPAACTCPHAGPARDNAPSQLVRPRYLDSSALLDQNDEIAALEAVRVALSQVGDGATYVWHRSNGRLSGVVQPTGSFKDLAGRVCRHIVLILSAGAHTGKIEGVACRLASGRWQLDG